MTATTARIVPSSSVNDLINHLHRVASLLDEEVEDVATETGLTEATHVTEGYTVCPVCDGDEGRHLSGCLFLDFLCDEVRR